MPENNLTIHHGVSNPPRLDMIVSLMCALTSIVGITINGGVALTWLLSKDIINTFGCISISLACADCGVLLVFAFTVAPFTYLKAHELSHRWPGHLSLTFWFASLYTMLLISINRYIAIKYPFRYKVIFNKRATGRAVGACWFMAIVHSCLYFVPGCQFSYDPSCYGWHYAQTPCYQLMFYLDLVYGAIFAILLFSINLNTLVKIHILNKRQDTTSGNHTSENMDRHGQEVRFFTQSVVNTGVLLVMLGSFHIISPFISDPFGIFLATSWLWQISHSTNGVLILIFHKKIRRKFLRCCCKAKVEPEVHKESELLEQNDFV